MSKLTRNERIWYDFIHLCQCGVCRRIGVRQEGDTELHHIDSAKINLFSIPLCRRHHTSMRDGWHGSRIDWINHSLTQEMIYHDTLIAASERGWLKYQEG